MTKSSQSSFLYIKNLSKRFKQTSGGINYSRIDTRAVDDVSFNLLNRECFGLVGETGSGKSTLGRCLIRLEDPDQGTLFHENQDLLALSSVNFRPYRQKFQMIFQNPGSSLNPIHTIRKILSEPMEIIGHVPKSSISARLTQLLSDVGLKTEILDYLPYQLSGGQKQRIAIARALAVEPSFIIADEPTSSIDASVRRQILDLLSDIRKNLGMTVLLISHDLSAIGYITDRTGVMHGGKLIEIAPTKELMRNPGHPYTRQLVQAFRRNNNFLSGSNQRTWISKDTPLTGCRFANICTFADKQCAEKEPKLTKHKLDRHVQCHYPETLIN